MKKALLVAVAALALGFAAAQDTSSDAWFYTTEMTEEIGLRPIFLLSDAPPCAIHAVLWDTITEKDKAEGTSRYYAQRAFTFAYDPGPMRASTVRYFLDYAGIAASIRYRASGRVEWLDPDWSDHAIRGKSRTYRAGDGEYIAWLVAESSDGRVYVCATAIILHSR